MFVWLSRAGNAYSSTQSSSSLAENDGRLGFAPFTDESPTSLRGESFRSRWRAGVALLVLCSFFLTVGLLRRMLTRQAEQHPALEEGPSSRDGSLAALGVWRSLWKREHLQAEAAARPEEGQRLPASESLPPLRPSPLPSPIPSPPPSPLRPSPFALPSPGGLDSSLTGGEERLLFPLPHQQPQKGPSPAPSLDPSESDDTFYDALESLEDSEDREGFSSTQGEGDGLPSERSILGDAAASVANSVAYAWNGFKSWRASITEAEIERIKREEDEETLRREVLPNLVDEVHALSDRLHGKGVSGPAVTRREVDKYVDNVNVGGN